MRHDKRMKMYNEGMTNIAKFFFFGGDGSLPYVNSRARKGGSMEEFAPNSSASKGGQDRVDEGVIWKK